MITSGHVNQSIVHVDENGAPLWVIHPNCLLQYKLHSSTSSKCSEVEESEDESIIYSDGDSGEEDEKSKGEKEEKHEESDEEKDEEKDEESKVEEEKEDGYYSGGAEESAEESEGGVPRQRYSSMSDMLTQDFFFPPQMNQICRCSRKIQEF